jgi:hypothetical protein
MTPVKTKKQTTLTCYAQGTLGSNIRARVLAAHVTGTVTADLIICAVSHSTRYTPYCMAQKFQHLTPRSRDLPEKITGPQLVRKFSAFYGTRSFISAFTTARYLSVS